MVTFPRHIQWRPLAFEVVVVFVGVFIALLVNQWNEDRQNRVLERQYLTRLAGDVAADTVELNGLIAVLDRKLAALANLSAWRVSALESNVSPDRLSAELITSMSAGFGIIRGTSTTFADLRSSGNLSLIRQADLRAAIVGYYELWSFNGNRVAVRRSGWPNLLYQLMPPKAFDPDVSFDSPAGTNVAIDRELVLAILRTPKGRHELNWEMNYGRFFRGVALDLLEQARALSTNIPEH